MPLGVIPLQGNTEKTRDRRLLHLINYDVVELDSRVILETFEAARVVAGATVNPVGLAPPTLQELGAGEEEETVAVSK